MIICFIIVMIKYLMITLNGKFWILVQNSNMYYSTVTFLHLIMFKICSKILGKLSTKVHSFEGDDWKTCNENNIKQFQFYFENNSILKFNS